MDGLKSCPFHSLSMVNASKVFDDFYPLDTESPPMVGDV